MGSRALYSDWGHLQDRLNIICRSNAEIPGDGGTRESNEFITRRITGIDVEAADMLADRRRSEGDLDRGMFPWLETRRDRRLHHEVTGQG